MIDETQKKIINATMELVMERGYSLTTTKDIAVCAGVNECTIFRRFKSKKDIIKAAMECFEWNPSLSASDFNYSGELESDLQSFSHVYMQKVTPQMVKVSIGLRSPELYEFTSEGIMKVPEVFKNILMHYFTEMKEKEKIVCDDIESLAMMFLSMNFGFVFLEASFGRKLSMVEKERYICESIRVFVTGIEKK